MQVVDAVYLSHRTGQVVTLAPGCVSELAST